MKNTLTEVTEDRYTEMLEVLPPACWLGGDFLVGEPSDHRRCRVTNNFAPTFSAFFEHNGKYFAADEALTRNEFKQAREDLHSEATQEQAS